MDGPCSYLMDAAFCTSWLKALVVPPRCNPGVFAAALGSSEPKRILERGSNVAYSDGHLLFVRENALMAQPFDVERLELAGEARAVADSIASAQNTFTPFLGTFSVSRSGLLAHQTEQRQARASLQWFDRGGKPLGEIGAVADFSDPELSPDGQQVAVSVYDAARRSRDIWVYPSKGGSGARLTIDLANAITPRWSSDGTEVFFSSTQKGVRDIYRKSSTGAGSETPLIADPVEKYLADFSPDRQYALIQVASPDTGTRLHVRPLTSDGKMDQLGFRKGNQYWGRFSPDGRWLAYYSDVSGRREVWVAKFPVDGSRWQVTTNGGWYPRWRRDGRELFYLGFDNTVYAVPVRSDGTAFQLGQPTRLFSFNPGRPFIPYDVTADGQRFIVTNLAESPDAMPITVLVNWMSAISATVDSRQSHADSQWSCFESRPRSDHSAQPRALKHTNPTAPITMRKSSIASFSFGQHGPCKHHHPHSNEDQAITHRVRWIFTKKDVKRRQSDEEDCNLANSLLDAFDTRGVQFHEAGGLKNTYRRKVAAN